MSTTSLESALFAGDSTPFVPTSEWQSIAPGQSVPAGLWMRMDISTGMRMARLMPQPGEQSATAGVPMTDVAAQETQQAQQQQQQQQQLRVRDEGFDDALPGAVTDKTFFPVYTQFFNGHAQFSKRSQ